MLFVGIAYDEQWNSAQASLSLAPTPDTTHENQFETAITTAVDSANIKLIPTDQAGLWRGYQSPYNWSSLVLHLQSCGVWVSVNANSATSKGQVPCLLLHGAPGVLGWASQNNGMKSLIGRNRIERSNTYPPTLHHSQRILTCNITIQGVKFVWETNHRTPCTLHPPHNPISDNWEEFTCHKTVIPKLQDVTQPVSSLKVSHQHRVYDTIDCSIELRQHTLEWRLASSTQQVFTGWWYCVWTPSPNHINGQTRIVVRIYLIHSCLEPTIIYYHWHTYHSISKKVSASSMLQMTRWLPYVSHFAWHCIQTNDAHLLVECDTHHIQSIEASVYILQPLIERTNRSFSQKRGRFWPKHHQTHGWRCLGG